MVSIVIPVFNEAESLPLLLEKIASMGKANGLELQVILVDDGSTDNSWSTIQSLAAQFPGVEGIRFRRNFGKAAALAAGIEQAKSDVVVTIDSDLQDEPNEIPKLIAKIDEGMDVVSGWKQIRHDPWHKTIPSRFFNGLVNLLSGLRLHDHNCGLKAYRREIFDEVKLYGEMHRFVPVLAAARGWRVCELPVTHHARRYGVSKYGVGRLIKGFLDLLTVYFLTGYRQRPQHFLGSIGLLCFAFGSFALAALTVAWAVTRMFDSLTPIHLHQRAIFFYAIIALLLGVQLISMGFLAEMITMNSRSGNAPYSISDRTKNVE
jgi:glycosyltransferase involved in cell wall biosynthesis